MKYFDVIRHEMAKNLVLSSHRPTLTTRKRRALSSLLTLVISLALPFAASAEALSTTGYNGTAEEIGLAIMKEAKVRSSGWGDSSSEMRMVLRNRHGEESIREMSSKALEVENDGDKAITVFNQPRDVNGTAFLSFSHILEPDDQWLYLPALKRVKRIASRNKSGPFMGSEFSFEDLSSFEVEKYTYRYLREEVVDGEQCWVVESYPVDQFSGYTRQIVWMDQSEYRVRKVDYYDRKNSLLKTQTFEDYQLHLDKFWRANVFHMVNHQNGKSTQININNLQFNVGLTDADFNQNTLKRAR